MLTKTQTFTHEDEIDLIRQLAKDFITDAKEKLDWFGDPVSFFTEDLVKAVTSAGSYLDISFHKVDQEELYDICEELFLTCNWEWTEDWHGQHFGPRSY